MAATHYYNNPTDPIFNNILTDIRKNKKIDDFLNKITPKSYFIWKMSRDLGIPRGVDHQIAYDFFEIEDLSKIKDINNEAERDNFIDDNKKTIKAYINDITNTKSATFNFNFQTKEPGIFKMVIPHIIFPKEFFDKTFIQNNYMIGFHFDKQLDDVEYAFFSIDPNDNKELEDFYNSLKSNNTQSSQNEGEHDENSPVNSNADPNTDPASTPHLPDYFKPENIIFYGVPGCGKSHHIKSDKCIEFYEDKEKNGQIERVVFHPDYTYSDFVGQILPETDNTSKLKYVFKPGPFTRILKEAYKHPSNEYYLIIEEINRGNAAAIFGDLFQLLDRDDKGYSEYNITNKDIADEIIEINKNKINNNITEENENHTNDGNIGKDKDQINSILLEELEKHKIRILNNLTLLATMNTSDQNVFTLDTAFQRRWRMKSIPNKFNDPDIEKLFIPGAKVEGNNVTWKDFVIWINEKILDKNAEGLTSEDKRLGTHFVKKSDLTNDLESLPEKEKEDKIEAFAEKVYKYLWDDAFKMSRKEVFVKGIKSLENIIDICNEEDKDKNKKNYNYKLEDIFLEAELKELIDKSISTSSADSTLGSTTGSSDDGGDAHKESVTPAAETTEDSEDADKTNEDITEKEEETPTESNEKTEENNPEE